MLGREDNRMILCMKGGQHVVSLPHSSTVMHELRNNGSSFLITAVPAVSHTRPLCPLVIITGSGQLADEIAAGWREQRRGSSAPPRAVHRAATPGLPGADQDLTKILTAGEIYLFAHEGTAANLRALLKQLVLPQEQRSPAAGHRNS